MTSVNATNAVDPTMWKGPATSKKMSDLGEGDFLQLMTAQLKQQDPFEPTDNSQMLAQMAQFTSLANTTKSNETLAQIAAKLDTLIAQQSSNGQTSA